MKNKKFLALFLMLALICSFTLPALAATPQQHLATGINQVRQCAGLPPLTLDDQLSAQAQAQAERMANTLSRQDSLLGQLSGALYTLLPLRGQTTAITNAPAGALAQWFLRPTSLQTLLGKGYTGVGIGMAQKNGKQYWVALYSSYVQQNISLMRGTNVTTVKKP